MWNKLIIITIVKLTIIKTIIEFTIKIQYFEKKIKFFEKKQNRIKRNVNKFIKK